MGDERLLIPHSCIPDVRCSAVVPQKNYSNETSCAASLVRKGFATS